nr:DMT family transporter [Shewanella intestini]
MALLAILLWSTVATAFKIALSFYTPMQLVLVATTTSILALSVILIWQAKLSLIKAQFIARPGFYLLTGLLNPLCYYLVLFKAYEQLPAQQALALNYTWAILLPLLAAPVLKHQLRATDILAALVAYAGVFVIATQGQLAQFSFANTLGIAFALLSTVIWCSYWIINTKDKGDPVISLTISFVVSWPLILSLTLTTQTLPSFSVDALFAGIYVGLFEMGISFVLWLMALKHTNKTSNISTLAFLTPVISIGFIAVILNEQIQTTTYYGLCLIVTGLFIQQLLPTFLTKRTPKLA